MLAVAKRFWPHTTFRALSALSLEHPGMLIYRYFAEKPIPGELSHSGEEKYAHWNQSELNILNNKYGLFKLEKNVNISSLLSFLIKVSLLLSQNLWVRRQTLARRLPRSILLTSLSINKEDSSSSEYIKELYYSSRSPPCIPGIFSLIWAAGSIRWVPHAQACQFFVYLFSRSGPNQHPRANHSLSLSLCLL